MDTEKYFVLKDKLNNGMVCKFSNGDYWEYSSASDDFVRSDLFYQYRLDYGAFTDLYDVLPKEEVEVTIEDYKHKWGIQLDIAKGFVYKEPIRLRRLSDKLCSQCPYIEYKPLIWIIPMISSGRVKQLSLKMLLDYGFNLRLSKMIMEVYKGYISGSFKDCFDSDYKLYKTVKMWSELVKDKKVLLDLEEHRLNANSKTSKREIKNMMYDIETKQILRGIEKGE